MRTTSGKCVSESNGVSLIQQFSLEEVKQVIWNRDGFKSPSPDEINFVILKEFWEDIKEEFLKLFSDFHNFVQLLHVLNNTFTALIPKRRIYNIWWIIY